MGLAEIGDLNKELDWKPHSYRRQACGLKPKELDRMESAFEHSDLARAAR